MHIRNAHERDREAITAIALLTGDSGRDATALCPHRALLADIFAIPYVIFDPRYAFVLEDERGVCGYVVAAADTDAFHERLECDWWPAMRERYPRDGTYTDFERRYVDDFVHASPPRLAADLRDYPAHFHINLLLERASGMGGPLLRAAFDALKADGVPGAHCGVGVENARANAFYRKVGARVVRQQDWGFVYGFTW